MFRRYIAFNNGGAITLTDINAEQKVGTTTVTWSSYVGVVGTATGDDGVAIGVKPALNQTLQGEFSLKVVGQINKIRKLERYILVGGTYTWTKSANGTNEYYLRSSTNGNPSIAFPAVLDRNAGTVGSPNYVQMARGIPGSLVADRWGYGDNDSLGYSTIYVRLSDDSNPASGISALLTCAS
jgi:hypothetical protein